MNQPEPEHPFDPHAAERVRAFVDLWLVPGRDAIERIHADQPYELRASDLHQLLEQLAYAKQTRHQLAEYCDRLRAHNADLHTRLDAMHTQWSAVHPHPVREEPCRHLEFSDESSVRAFVARGHGWHIEHRRVGEWQPAENDTP